ncbi:Ig-like domain-containing protein [Aciditerrimonas ferrireducens]|uniref:Ig-like domain-containing protein n=1 Tax=Aciditerrimonas ferrireducens TaxID=667306 RepID=A0ABV6C021_9ACTN
MGLWVGAAGVAGAATSPVSPTVLVVSGSLQSAKVATAFAEPLTLSVSCQGTSVAGAAVTFEAPASGASASFVTTQAALEAVQTGSDGTASSGELEANDVVGTYEVTATVSVPSSSSSSTTSSPCAGASASTTFTLTNLAGSPSSVSVVSGSDQSTAVGTTFSAPLVVSVTDQYGNPVSGVAVNFVVEADDGATATFATGGGQASATTASDGEASSPALSAGTTAGSFTVLAEVSGASAPAVFALSDLPGPPATVTAGVGAEQQTQIGTAFPIPLAVTVKDADGNPVPGVAVTFSAPSSGASGTFAAAGTSVTVTTNSDGVAVAPTFSANEEPGGYVVEATVSGVAPAVFALVNEEPMPSATTTSGAATSLGAASGGPGTSVVGMVVDPATGGYWLVGADGRGGVLVRRAVLRRGEHGAWGAGFAGGGGRCAALGAGVLGGDRGGGGVQLRAGAVRGRSEHNTL